MGIVYLLGAGASYGESLLGIPNEQVPNPPIVREPGLPNPPVNNGFFSDTLWRAIGYDPETVAADFSDLVDYIRQIRPNLPAALGTGAWCDLDVEEILTSIELDREFESADSDTAGRLIIVKNKLIRFIWRILGSCTEGSFGEFARQIVSSLALEDSVLTFNWDLLLDQEFHPFRPHQGGEIQFHYSNFFALCLKQPILPQGGALVVAGPHDAQGVYLKLHGSLNWFYCTNTRCPAHSEIRMDMSISNSLQRAVGIHWTDETCKRCGSSTSPLLIPPLLRKPITENWIIRSMWGIARRRLAAADKLVVIGFSGAPTDFYAAWLLRSTVGVRQNAEVYVVNPENAADHPNNQEFSRRMRATFPFGYNAEFNEFSQIRDIINRLHPVRQNRG